MTPNQPPISGPPPLTQKRRPWILYILGGMLAFLLLIVATVAITIWWIQRPIKPVVLTPKEQAVVQAKVRYLEEPKLPPATSAGQGANTLTAPAPAPSGLPPEGSTYVPGGKTLKLTQREINGLLNENTDLGHTVRLEFDRDAINAYLAVPIPQDFPIGGGKMFRARGRFRLSIGNGGQPYAILEDVTVFGISLPQAWLGGLKGQNLLGDAMHGSNGGPVLRGIKSLRVEPGALVLEVED